MISANTVMRHSDDAPTVTTQRRGPDLVFLTFEGLTVQTRNGSKLELEAERESARRQIERRKVYLAKLDRMIEAMKWPTSP